jgi:hypothetical protein
MQILAACGEAVVEPKSNVSVRVIFFMIVV